MSWADATCRWCEQNVATDEKLWLTDNDPQLGEIPTCMECAITYDIENKTRHLSKFYGLPFCYECRTPSNNSRIESYGVLVQMSCRCKAIRFIKPDFRETSRG